jgi:hypothetical protein
VNLVFFTAIRSSTEKEKEKNWVSPLGPNIWGTKYPYYS